MKIIISEKQLEKIVETVNDDKVICDNCGWSWNIKEGGDDLYVCHKCGHNNEQVEN
jgi:ribosomal protein L37AE/L43A